MIELMMQFNLKWIHIGIYLCVYGLGMWYLLLLLIFNFLFSIFSVGFCFKAKKKFQEWCTNTIKDTFLEQQQETKIFLGVHWKGNRVILFLLRFCSVKLGFHPLGQILIRYPVHLFSSFRFFTWSNYLFRIFFWSGPLFY